MSKMTTEMLFASKKDCCGCEMCAQSCPKGIITMMRDAEGFLYPHIKDNAGCVECEVCQNVCPVKHVNEIHSDFLKAYAGWDKINEEVISSSSGSAATTLSRTFIKNGGIVYGVTYGNNCRSIEYIRVNQDIDLYKLKSSKYAQATTAGIVENIRKDIKDGNKVLFIGLPCVCAAIKRAFRNTDNLYIVSLICHGPTSPLVHEQFCDILEKKYRQIITKFSVRHKKDGYWKPYYVFAEFEDGSQHLEKFDESVYNKAFLFFKRPSCNVCVFKVDKFDADLLIGDFHAAKPGTETYNENGVSSILVLTERGEERLWGITESFFYKEASLPISTHQIGINRPIKARANRIQFSSTLQEKGIEAAAKLPSVALTEVLDKLIKKVKVTGVKLRRLIR